jgi:Flp pilus assembly pilin Flp
MHSESGQTNAELGLILVVLSIAAIVILGVAAASVNDFYSDTAALVRAAIA